MLFETNKKKIHEAHNPIEYELKHINKRIFHVKRILGRKMEEWERKEYRTILKDYIQLQKELKAKMKLVKKLK